MFPDTFLHLFPTEPKGAGSGWGEATSHPRFRSLSSGVAGLCGPLTMGRGNKATCDAGMGCLADPLARLALLSCQKVRKRAFGFRGKVLGDQSHPQPVAAPGCAPWGAVLVRLWGPCQEQCRDQ